LNFNNSAVNSKGKGPLIIETKNDLTQLKRDSVMSPVIDNLLDSKY